jgi:hypothetical protein
MIVEAWFMNSGLFFIWVAVLLVGVILIFLNKFIYRLVGLIFILIFSIFFALVVEEESRVGNIGKALDFFSLKENQWMKFESNLEEMKVGIISNQEGEWKGESRIVKNIDPRLKPGDDFILRDKDVFIKLINQFPLKKSPEEMK